jgi:hypothetical protein
MVGLIMANRKSRAVYIGRRGDDYTWILFRYYGRSEYASLICLPVSDFWLTAPCSNPVSHRAVS